MSASILYSSRQDSLDYLSNIFPKPFYYLPYGLWIILCVPGHHVTEPTWVGLGRTEPRARAMPKAQGFAGPGPGCPQLLGPWALVPGPGFYGPEPDPSRLGNMMGSAV